MYRNAAVAVTLVADAMLMTLMSTGPSTTPEPVGFVKLAVGAITVS